MNWTADNRWNSLRSLNNALLDFHRDLPGWWLSFGECSVSCHASCGPDRNGREAFLLSLDDQTFDQGFHADLDQPSTMADAINDVRLQALAHKKAL